MNPPFHQGRDTDPALGQAFVRQSGRILARHGALWMVANRHLPYETALKDAFAQVEEVGGDNRFKVIRAARPLRQA
jgi:16S rRNA (guanine1207-N2)-methyltransferase